MFSQDVLGMSEWPSGVIVDPHTMEQVIETLAIEMENIGNGKSNDVGQSPHSSISTIRSNTTSTRTRRTETSLAKAFTINTGERHNNK